jgi:hypothetical protein
MARPRKELDVVQTFRGPRVLVLEDLCHRLHCSRSTVLRRLAEHSYCSSYNYSGRFLTIAEVADFDLGGLWAWKTARFSRHGNLKETVRHFVEDSEGGMTHKEMAALLGVRAHNTLLDLVEEKRVRRERLGPTFVYVSRKAAVRRAQVRRRKSFLAKRRKLRPSSRQIIATLLELIRDPLVQRQEIVLRCQRIGVSISRDLVDAIFETYELDKKRAP